MLLFSLWLMSFFPWVNANPLFGVRLYVEPNSNAAQQAAAWRTSRPADAVLMDQIAATPQCDWFGGWNGNITVDVNNYVTAAQAQGGAMPCLVLYNIPFRDCGSYSAGGAAKDADYRVWINAVAQGIGPRQALLLLEPDAIAGLDCLSGEGQQARLSLLSYATATLKGLPRVVLYHDAGHSNWQPASVMAQRLVSAGIRKADGFMINVSNFRPFWELFVYSEKLSALLEGKHYIFDTSRNGLSAVPDGQIFNPPWAALGMDPSTVIGFSPLFQRLDAVIWAKRIGESDGPFNGCGDAGTWCPTSALQMAKNRQVALAAQH